MLKVIVNETVFANGKDAMHNVTVYIYDRNALFVLFNEYMPY